MNRQHDEKRLTILYERLSREDGEDSVSNSIKNQQNLLQEYAERNGLAPYEHVFDDGYSGTGWNRPGWQKVICEIEAGRVQNLVVKNLDRMGRDYLRVGLYMEMFRDKGIRLIAIGDGIDTARGEDDFTPFRAVLGEWYARDCSRKIKAVMDAKGKSGRHLTNSAIYGYRKSADNKNEWLVDEEAAAVVRRIFHMTIEGKGPYQIARTLTDEKIMRPSVYIAMRDGGAYTPVGAAQPYTWGGATIVNILGRQEYMGSTVNFRTRKDSYKDNKHVHRPQEEWAVFDGTQEPIVDAATWQTAQKCRKVKRRANSTGEANPLTGLVYCAQCGGRMHNHRSSMAQKYDSQDSYACNQYTKYPPQCTMHYITTSALRSLALDAIRKASLYARENETEFIMRVREDAEIRNADAAKAQRKQLTRNKKRCAELDALIKRLYEDKISGELTAKRFDILSREFEDEQENLEQQIAELQAGLDRFGEDGERAERFMELVRRHTDFSELSAPMLHEFVQKIVVHEAERINGQRVQTVDVFLNFIGKFEIPGDEQDAEPEPFDPAERKRAQWREYYYRNREKQLAAAAERNKAKKAAVLAAHPVKTPEELAAEEEARREKKRAYHRKYQREWQRRRREREAASIAQL